MSLLSVVFVVVPNYDLLRFQAQMVIAKKWSRTEN